MCKILFNSGEPFFIVDFHAKNRSSEVDTADENFIFTLVAIKQNVKRNKFFHCTPTTVERKSFTIKSVAARGEGSGVVFVSHLHLRALFDEWQSAAREIIKHVSLLFTASLYNARLMCLLFREI